MIVYSLTPWSLGLLEMYFRTCNFQTLCNEWYQAQCSADGVREIALAKCLINGKLTLVKQCMKWPVAHSPNSTWFWFELVGNCCERLRIIMEYTNIQFCEQLGHGWQFHPLVKVMATNHCQVEAPPFRVTPWGQLGSHGSENRVARWLWPNSEDVIYR